MIARRGFLAAGAALMAAATMTAPADAKRRAPDPVAPVSFEGRRYEAVPWGKARGLGQNGGYVAAIDEATGREVWIRRIYAIRYCGMEGDKQDNFITSLRLVPGARALVIENERGGRYRLDLRTRQVRGE